MTNLASNPRAWRAVKAPSLADLEVLAGEIFRRLPRRFRNLCANIVIQVDDFPSDEVLDQMGAETEFDLLGLFQGVGLPFRSESAPVQMLNMIWLYRRAYVIPKGGIDRVKADGLAEFHRRVLLMSPFLADRIGELKSFDDIKLLSVTVDRLRQWWRPGLICIGDAAHAMSPIGGVGINIAIQDAVAAANRLAGPLKASKVSNDDLRAIEDRRRFPARMTQAIQLTMQNQIIRRALAGTKRPKPPLLFKLFDRIPALQRIPGRLLAVGVRPEHVQTPDVLGPGS